MPCRFDNAVGATCSTCAIPSRCAARVSVSAAVRSTVVSTRSRLSRTNRSTSTRTASSPASAAPMSSRFASRISVTDASRSWKETIWSPLIDSASTKTCRLPRVPNRSCRPSEIVRIAVASCCRLSRRAGPCPSALAAATSRTSPSAPCGSVSSGPSSVVSRVSCSVISSHSTGTAVRSTGIVAPTGSSGPPVCGGVSWTKRAETRVGATIAACASAGMRRSESMSKRTRTRSPRGSIFVTRPTSTPMMRTSSPTYRPRLEVNSAAYSSADRHGATVNDTTATTARSRIGTPHEIRGRSRVTVYLPAA